MQIKFDNLAYQLMPPHKRKPNRFALFKSFLEPLAHLFIAFDRWRTDTRMLINVTSQVKVLEGYLRWRFNEPNRIKILTYNDQLLTVGLIAEGVTHFAEIGNKNELMIQVPLSGELRSDFEDTDFVVITPVFNKDDKFELITAVENYKQALTRYKIIEKE